jgi:hypothetical protein
MGREGHVVVLADRREQVSHVRLGAAHLGERHDVEEAGPFGHAA